MKAVQIVAFGKPTEVLQVADVPNVGAPGPNEVVIALEASPINPSDLFMFTGNYGYRPPLPSIVGAEGAGRVVAVGSNVKHLKEGDHSIVPFGSPTWAERIKVDATWLRPLPAGDIKQFAMLGVNPATAYLLLTDFVAPQPGQWVIQNGANSGVGRAVIPIAKSLGLKTVNVVRRAELVDEIKALGGNIVLLDGADLPKRVAEATGNAPITLALDVVGDTGTTGLLGSLAQRGTLVSYGAMTRKAMVAPPQPLIFKDITIRGFWLVTWLQKATPKMVAEMYDRLVPMVASGSIATPIAATFPFEQVTKAIETAIAGQGKALLTP
jgi:NADPH:quinone reductase-like Zn-dependent oxidoreductase